MAHLLVVREIARSLNRYKPLARLPGSAKNLPDAYKRFWLELHETPTPVHWKPKEEGWTTDKHGVVKPIQNVPIPVRYPDEVHDGIWGGEAVIQGFKQDGNRYHRRTPKWWIPTLRESVLYSEVLKKHMKIIVTDRAIALVHEHQGFDQYLLNTRACDLVSWLALGLKRKILLCIRDDTYPHQGDERERVKKQYEHYLSTYDPEFIEWYGLRMEDAVEKYKKMQFLPMRPKKEMYRQKLLQSLKEGTYSPLVLAEPQTGAKSYIEKIKSKIF